jgi:NitT/TauT family transport system permease protein
METSRALAADSPEVDFERMKKQRVWRGLRRGTVGLVQPILTALCLLLLWQLIVVGFDVPRYLFPAPTDVVEQGIQYAPKIWFNYSTTLRSAALGYLVAVVVAVPVSLIIAYSTFAQKSVYPGLVLVHMTPKVALAPLIIAWMGFGLAPKVTVTALLCFMPIMLNGILGFRSIDPEIVYMSRSSGARPWLMFWKIRLPSALPTLFTGLKHGASLAIVGAVVAEYIGGNRGLGYYLLRSLDNLQTDLGIAIMVAMATIGMAFFFGMHAVEGLAIPWHVSKRRAAREGGS